MTYVLPASVLIIPNFPPPPPRLRIVPDSYKLRDTDWRDLIALSPRELKQYRLQNYIIHDAKLTRSNVRLRPTNYQLEVLRVHNDWLERTKDIRNLTNRKRGPAPRPPPEFEKLVYRDHLWPQAGPQPPPPPPPPLPPKPLYATPPKHKAKKTTKKAKRFSPYPARENFDSFEAYRKAHNAALKKRREEWEKGLPHYDPQTLIEEHEAAKLKARKDRARYERLHMHFDEHDAEEEDNDDQIAIAALLRLSEAPPIPPPASSASRITDMLRPPPPPSSSSSSSSSSSAAPSSHITDMLRPPTLAPAPQQFNPPPQTLEPQQFIPSLPAYPHACTASYTMCPVIIPTLDLYLRPVANPFFTTNLNSPAFMNASVDTVLATNTITRDGLIKAFTIPPTSLISSYIPEIPPAAITELKKGRAAHPNYNVLLHSFMDRYNTIPHIPFLPLDRIPEFDIEDYMPDSFTLEMQMADDQFLAAIKMLQRAQVRKLNKDLNRVDRRDLRQMIAVYLKYQYRWWQQQLLFASYWKDKWNNKIRHMGQKPAIEQLKYCYRDPEHDPLVIHVRTRYPGYRIFEVAPPMTELIFVQTGRNDIRTINMDESVFIVTHDGINLYMAFEGNFVEPPEPMLSEQEIINNLTTKINRFFIMNKIILYRANDVPV